MPVTPVYRGTLVCAVSLAVASCATQPAEDTRYPLRAIPNKGVSSISPALADAVTRSNDPNVADRAKIYTGTGVVIKGQQPGAAAPVPPPAAQVTGGGIVLNFEAADLREVVRNILGDILNESYTIDPAVGGQVTIRTSAGIPREALPATLETLLRMNGATMVKEGGLYKVLPSAAAVRGNVTPQLGSSQRTLPSGFSVQIVPLRYVGAREMLRIMEPFAKDAAAIRADDTRNLLILAGTEIELRHLMDTVAMFDIDWMSGMSAGVFTLQNSDVKSLMQEFDKILGDRNTSPLAGVLRVIPIERMNAILVISPNPAYVEEAKKWIERLDGGSGEGVRFYVYNLQNTRAERVAPLMQQAFTGRVTQQAANAPPTVAPGTPPGQIVNPPLFQTQPSGTTATPPAPTPPVQAVTRAGAAGEGTGIARNVQVVADKDQNTILIVATPSEYAVVEQALKKLDVQSRQVMIDVTIAEVVLSDDLQFGVEWLFKGGAPSGRGSGGFFAPGGTSPFNPAIPVGAIAAGAVSPVLGLASGFNYIINNANFLGGVQAVLHLLDTYGNTRVVANPHLAALDNQKATIKSGDRIPISQQTFVGSGVGTVTNAVTTTSQYIDTGVLLQVTPHINAGGLVTLDVQAEVSNPGTPASAGEAPPIATRSVQTLVSVPSGRTMVMGGLIRDAKSNTTNGLPLLDRIPILGGLFGKQELRNDRTELIIFITPRVIENEIDYDAVMQDLRRKMDNLDRVFPGTPGWPAAPASYGDRLDKILTPKEYPAVPPPSPEFAYPPPAGQPTPQLPSIPSAPWPNLTPPQSIPIPIPPP